MFNEKKSSCFVSFFRGKKVFVQNFSVVFKKNFLREKAEEYYLTNYE
jgi:hypothetical protein